MDSTARATTSASGRAQDSTARATTSSGGRAQDFTTRATTSASGRAQDEWDQGWMLVTTLVKSLQIHTLGGAELIALAFQCAQMLMQQLQQLNPFSGRMLDLINMIYGHLSMYAAHATGLDPSDEREMTIFLGELCEEMEKDVRRREVKTRLSTKKKKKSLPVCSIDFQFGLMNKLRFASSATDPLSSRGLEVNRANLRLTTGLTIGEEFHALMSLVFNGCLYYFGDHRTVTNGIPVRRFYSSSERRLVCQHHIERTCTRKPGHCKFYVPEGDILQMLERINVASKLVLE